MASPINGEASAELDWAPKREAIIDDPDVPRSIPTSATEFAPKGRIIDDSARGTIFWEAENEHEDSPAHEGEQMRDPGFRRQESDASAEAAELARSPEAQAFGKPFRIEWLSTNRLPFYRTRGLRNPWNANREVKIARDGTELETNVGRRLIQMFSQGASPADIRAPFPPPPGRWP